MSANRAETSHDRLSSFRNGVSPIITVASVGEVQCMHGQRGRAASLGASGKACGVTWLWTST